MPTPMARRSTPRSSTPNPQACFPRIATTVARTAKPSTAGEAKLRRSTFQAGVAGILPKYHSTELLCGIIRQVAAGEVYLEKEYLGSLFRPVDRTRQHQRPALTERDKTVLRFIFQGLTNKDIGARLNISESAVKSSLRQLFEKLGVRTRAQLVRVALERYRDQL
jgi:two-component system, NarL family, nitrate/nitrite response regulator NarL